MNLDKGFVISPSRHKNARHKIHSRIEILFFIKLGKKSNLKFSFIHYSLFIIHYSLFIIHYSLFIIHYSLFIIHYSLFIIHYSLFIIHYSLSIINSISYIAENPFACPLPLSTSAFGSTSCKAQLPAPPPGDNDELQ